VFVLVGAFASIAHADTRADMRRALVVHVELTPGPITLPGSKLADASRSVTPSIAPSTRNRSDPDPNALAHGAQDAAASAAGQAQASAAQNRARQHPTPR
jgi:hypothetical protein